MSLSSTANEYALKGFSVVPVVLSDKRPTIAWSRYQKERMGSEEIDERFGPLNGQHGIAMVCGQVSGGLEVIDFDNHFGDIEKVFTEYMAIDEVKAIVEKYKLPWETSQSGGYHLFYRCELVSGSKKLAERKNPKQDFRLSTVIETKGEGGYVIVAPSKGYQVKSANPITEAPVITAEERDILHAYAKAFGESDIKKSSNPKLVKVDPGELLTGETLPQRYNNDATDEEILGLLQQAGWSLVGRNHKNWMLRRPGKKTGISATYDGRVFYCFTSNGQPFDPNKGHPKFDVFKHLKHGSDWRKAYGELRERFGENIQNDTPETEGSIRPGFFITVTDAGNGNRRTSIDYQAFIQFLTQNGFRKFKKDKETILVRVVDNLVEEVTIGDIMSFTKAFVRENLSDPRILSALIEKDALWNKQKTEFLDELPNDFMKSTRDDGWLFFKNMALKVSKSEELEAYEYNELPKPIWKNKLLDRKIDLGLLLDTEKGDVAEIETFIERVTKHSSDRKDAMMRAIGYLLHPFKNPSEAKAIIFQDEEIPKVKGMANGGTGKSLIAKYIATYRRVAFKGANAISKEKTEFLFDLVNLDTEVMVFDDASALFPFDVLFPYITGDWEINKKYVPRMSLPAEDAPKILITTNHTIGKIGASDERRKYTVEFGNHYGLDLTPADEFNHNLIDDWDADEQHRADRFAIRCLRRYLKDGLAKECEVNARLRQAIDQCGHEFVTFVIRKVKEGFITRGEVFDKKVLYDSMKFEFEELSDLPFATFTRRLVKFMEIFNLGYANKRSGNRQHGVIYKNPEKLKKMLPEDEINRGLVSNFQNSEDDVI